VPYFFGGIMFGKGLDKQLFLLPYLVHALEKSVVMWEDIEGIKPVSSLKSNRCNLSDSCEGDMWFLKKALNFNVS
jgi:hypothetical protein